MRKRGKEMPGSRFLMWHVVVANLPLSFDQRRRHWRESPGPAELLGTGVGLKGSGRCPVPSLQVRPPHAGPSTTHVPRACDRPQPYIRDRSPVRGCILSWVLYIQLYCIWKLNIGWWRLSNSSVIVCRTMSMLSCLLHNFARLVTHVVNDYRTFVLLEFVLHYINPGTLYLSWAN